jgi:hypothetical protein
VGRALLREATPPRARSQTLLSNPNEADLGGPPCSDYRMVAWRTDFFRARIVVFAAKAVLVPGACDQAPMILLGLGLLLSPWVLEFGSEAGPTANAGDGGRAGAGGGTRAMDDHKRPRAGGCAAPWTTNDSTLSRQQDETASQSRVDSWITLRQKRGGR